MNEDIKKKIEETQEVECLIKREGVTHLMIGTMKYVFYPNFLGHNVCTVPEPAHRKQLYSTPGCFRPYKPKLDYPHMFRGDGTIQDPPPPPVPEHPAVEEEAPMPVKVPHPAPVQVADLVKKPGRKAAAATTLPPFEMASAQAGVEG